MRPYIFKLMDAARDEAARFSAWVKARGLTVSKLSEAKNFAENHSAGSV